MKREEPVSDKSVPTSFVPAVWADQIAAEYAAALARIEANPTLRAMRDLLESECEE